MDEKFKDPLYMNIFLAALSGASANQFVGNDIAHAFAEDVADAAFARVNGAPRRSAKEIRLSKPV
jgi:hypothetical protein